MIENLCIVFLLFGLANGVLFASSKQVYKEGDQMNMKVNGLSSSKTHIPYEYYYLPFPKVTSVVVDSLNSLISRFIRLHLLVSC